MKLTNLVKNLVIAGTIATTNPAVANSHFISDINTINTSLTATYELEASGSRVVTYGREGTDNFRIIEIDLESGIEKTVKDFGQNLEHIDIDELQVSSSTISWVERHEDNKDWDGDGDLDDSELTFTHNELGNQCISTNERVYDLKLSGDNLMFIGRDDNDESLLLFKPTKGLRRINTPDLEFFDFDITDSGAYAFIEEQMSGEDKLTFFDGSNTNIIEGSLTRPLKIDGINVLYKDNDMDALMSANYLFTRVQCVLRDSERIEKLILSDDEKYLFLSTRSTWGNDMLQAYRIVGQNSLEYISTFTDELYDATADDTGLYFALDNDENQFNETTYYHYEKLKGLSNLETKFEDRKRRIVLSNGSLIKITPDRQLIQKTVDEIALPTEYDPEILLYFDKEDLEESVARVYSQGMQGKLLSMQASTDLQYWVDVRNRRMVNDEPIQISQDFNDIWEDMAYQKRLIDPNATLEDEQIIYEELSNGPLFIRAQMKY